MSDRTVELREADDPAYVETLLDREDLPTGDLETADARFFVASDGGERVGVGGLETYGSTALLRSVVVEPGVRGEGFGTALCDALEARARALGVAELYLLTTTARGFFEDRGYDVVERAAVPPAIQGTTEFADLCPDSATCMLTSL